MVAKNTLLWAEDRLEDFLEKIEEKLLNNTRPASEIILGEKDALKLLPFEKRTLATLRAEGKIKYSKVRGVILYTLQDILDMVKENEIVVNLPKSRI